ncbi:HEAT repeat domain-containing protein [Thiomicrorhabdus xiamenensis]|uniref:HEAT repeat domain-containing protein n=1 Tax=Thiomicrorhabdus xiamenensis TaxID=2739063 RepID=A0A7D4T0S8_9GAMM|nr:HEAT repeat domain-containing protein [Thiomicrorhabdus xiamenensis]QKI89382.1 HEAT repeat domain-containing protein [Thiomicrorhabdus xiamenensis]
MIHKLHNLFIFFFLLQLPLQALADNLSSKHPQTKSDPVVRDSLQENRQAFDEIQEFAMQNCLEQCQRRHQNVAMGFEAIMTECHRQCEKKQALQRVQSNDLEEKSRGIRQFCLLAEKSDVPELLSLLKEDLNQRTGIWAEIIPTLGRLKDVRAIPLLTDLLQLADEDWLGREMSAQALGAIGDSRAVPVLIQSAWMAETRDEAIAALAQIVDARAAPVLVSAIQPDEEPQTQESAANGLIRLGSAAVADIRQELNNYSRENRQTQKRVQLCQILGAMHNAPADLAIRELAKDSDPAVRQCAQKMLQEKAE